MFISSFIKSGQSGMLVCVQFIKLLLNKSLKKQDKNSEETSSIMFLVVGEEQKIQMSQTTVTAPLFLGKFFFPDFFA